jgi:hypothetical protein
MERLCGHVVSPATREQTVMEEIPPDLYNGDYLIVRKDVT